MENNSAPTIAALSSAYGKSGVAVIRMSGGQSERILKEMLKTGSPLADRKMLYGEITAGENKDQVTAVIYRAPRSYTGEDVAEIFCHGNNIIISSILEEIIKRGARLAERGEFTRRAFENGKMDLTQAEGVIDLIEAQSRSAVKAAYAQAGGRLAQDLNAIKEKLVKFNADIDVTIDYPEEYEENDYDSYILQAQEISSDLQRLLKSYAAGKKANEGISVAIVGEPNAGKSTLMNALLGYDRAIVTDEAGTTRDTVEDAFEYHGVRFKLIDTAGIRKAESEAERQGIERSKKAAQSADIVLALSDNMKGIRIFNKADINDYGAVDGLKISAKTGEGISRLKELLYRETGEINYDETMLVNLRQYEACLSAALSMEKAMDTLKEHGAVELAAVDLMNALSAICSVLGIRAVEETVNSIFARFCVGK